MNDLQSRLRGLWPPLVTPFRNGELDQVSLRRMVRHYAGSPIDGLVLAATSGEGLSLGISELEQLVRLTRSEISCRPIVLYNIPYRTAVNLENATLLQLAVHPNIVGIKDCGADRAQSIDFLRRRPPGFRVLTGEDARYYKALVDGADGAILLSAHIETDMFASVWTHLKQGDRDAAQARWNSISNLTQLLFAEPSPARTGLIDSAEVRLPMVAVSAPLAARLDAEIDRLARPAEALVD
jgi:dihydrodipicolinate synthase/N-acetylneuraminate lyase